MKRSHGASLKITKSKVVEIGASPSQSDVDTALADALHDTGKKRQIGYPRMDRKTKFNSGKDRIGISLAAPHEITGSMGARLQTCASMSSDWRNIRVSR